MIKKYMIAACLISVMLPSLGFAQTPPQFKLDDLKEIKLDAPSLLRNPGEFGEAQWWLYNGTVAPTDGLFLNPEAVAVILSEYNNLILRSELALKTQREADLTKLNLETSKLTLQLNAQTEKSLVLIAAREAEIESWKRINRKIVEDKSGLKGKIFLGLGVGAAGVAIGLIVGLLVH